MDADGDGALDASALDDSPYCQVAWSDDLESSDACGEKLIKEIDNNGDGKVHFTLTPTLTLALTLALTLTLTLTPTLTLTLTLTLAPTLTLTLGRLQRVHELVVQAAPPDQGGQQ